MAYAEPSRFIQMVQEKCGLDLSYFASKGKVTELGTDLMTVCDILCCKNMKDRYDELQTIICRHRTLFQLTLGVFGTRQVTSLLSDIALREQLVANIIRIVHLLPILLTISTYVIIAEQTFAMFQLNERFNKAMAEKQICDKEFETFKEKLAELRTYIKEIDAKIERYIKIDVIAYPDEEAALMCNIKADLRKARKECDRLLEEQKRLFGKYSSLRNEFVELTDSYRNVQTITRIAATVSATVTSATLAVPFLWPVGGVGAVICAGLSIKAGFDKEKSQDTVQDIQRKLDELENSREQLESEKKLLDTLEKKFKNSNWEKKRICELADEIEKQKKEEEDKNEIVQERKKLEAEKAKVAKEKEELEAARKMIEDFKIKHGLS